MELVAFIGCRLFQSGPKPAIGGDAAADTEYLRNQS